VSRLSDGLRGRTSDRRLHDWPDPDEVGSRSDPLQTTHYARSRAMEIPASVRYPIVPQATIPTRLFNGHASVASLPWGALFTLRGPQGCRHTL